MRKRGKIDRMIESVQNAYPMPSVTGWLYRQCGRFVTFVASIKPIGWVLIPILWPLLLLVCLAGWIVFAIQMRRSRKGLSRYTDIMRDASTNKEWDEDDQDSINAFGMRLTRQTASLILYWDLMLDEYADAWVKPIARASEFGAFLYPQEMILWRAVGEISQFHDVLNELAEVYLELSERWPATGTGTKFSECLETAEILADRAFYERLQRSINQTDAVAWSEAKKTLGL